MTTVPGYCSYSVHSHSSVNIVRPFCLDLGNLNIQNVPLLVDPHSLPSEAKGVGEEDASHSVNEMSCLTGCVSSAQWSSLPVAQLSHTHLNKRQ